MSTTDLSTPLVVLTYSKQILDGRPCLMVNTPGLPVPMIDPIVMNRSNANRPSQWHGDKENEDRMRPKSVAQNSGGEVKLYGLSVVVAGKVRGITVLYAA